MRNYVIQSRYKLSKVIKRLCSIYIYIQLVALFEAQFTFLAHWILIFFLNEYKDGWPKYASNYVYVFDCVTLKCLCFLPFNCYLLLLLFYLKKILYILFYIILKKSVWVYFLQVLCNVYDESEFFILMVSFLYSSYLCIFSIILRSIFNVILLN